MVGAVFLTTSRLHHYVNFFYIKIKRAYCKRCETRLSKHFKNDVFIMYRAGLPSAFIFSNLVKITIYSIFVWVGNVFSFYPLYYAYDLQNKTISSLLILMVIVAILITIVPTPGFLGSYNAGVFIALHEIMGESEIKAVSIGMVGWVLFAGVILLSGLYFIFYDHISLKTLTDINKDHGSLLDKQERGDRKS